MKKSVLIRRIKDISSIDTNECDYIYFGVEFCQWLIPSFAELKNARSFCKESGKKLVLLTPWVTDKGLELARNLISRFLKDEPTLEVVVNDFGMLKLLSEEFGDKLTLIAGRLLSNQRRDPRTLSLKEIGSKELYEHYQNSSFNYQPYIDFLAKFNVKRVELDNLLQGIASTENIKGVSFSLYYPYNYVTIARNCPFCYNDADEKKGCADPWNNKEKCSRKCLNSTLKLTCDEIKEPLLLKGTTIFVKNEKLALQECKNIDRLIYSPYVPV